MQATALVTGGAGFIGSHLCRRLLMQGYKVIVVDNFNDFYNPAIKRKNIEKELQHPDYKLYEADIVDEHSIQEIFNSHKIDIVIHLAAMAGVRSSIENPRLYVNVNVQGTIHLLEAMQKHGIKKMVFASSSSVYGYRNDLVPLAEDMLLQNMISPYAVTKKTGEDFCYYFHQQYGIDVMALRFFTVYGPGQRPDLAIHKFVKMITEGKELTIYGDGSSLRDYTYIDDIIDGVTSAVKYVENHQSVFEIVNLSGKNMIGLIDMVKQLETALAKKANLVYLPPQAGDVLYTRADLTKAQKLLNYNPQTSFETGIEKFVAWYRNSKL